jgi:adenylylsulfate kinase-like enzyme
LQAPDIHVRTTEMSLDQEVEAVLAALRQRGIVD